MAERVWPLLADGTIAPTPQTTFALADAAAAHAHLESGDNLGKVVLVVPELRCCGRRLGVVRTARGVVRPSATVAFERLFS